MKKTKFNSGWKAATIAWIISSIIFPFLPELMKSIFNGYPLSLNYPFSEYMATIGFWGAIFLLFWIPAGFKASRIYKEVGFITSRNYVIKVFIIMLIILSFIFRFLWNS